MNSENQQLPPTGPISGLREKDLLLLGTYGSFQSAASGEVLIQQGDFDNKVIFTLSGILQAKRKTAGHTQIVGTFGSGEWIGLVNVFDPGVAFLSVEAFEATHYWVIERDALEKFINTVAAGSKVN